MIQFWLNDISPTSIKKIGHSYVQKGIDDVVFLNLTYNDIMVNIHVSWLDPHKVRKITIVGSKKMIIYDDMEENKVAIFDKGIDKTAILGEDMDFDNQNNFYLKHRSGGVIYPKINWEEPLKKEIDHFIDCIKDDKSCLTGPEHAEKVVSILEGRL